MIDRRGPNPGPVQRPLGAEGDFLGIIDLVTMMATTYTDDLGKAVIVGEIPAELLAGSKAARAPLLEGAPHYDHGPPGLRPHVPETPVSRPTRAPPQPTPA